MLSKDQLQKMITPLDGKDYGAYQSLIGTYDFEQFVLIIDQIPKDPYAPPHTGIYRIQFPLGDTAIQSDMIDSRTGEIACRDFYARQFFITVLRLPAKDVALVTVELSRLMNLDRPSLSEVRLFSMKTI